MSPSVTPAPAAAVLFACSGDEESEQVQDEHESHESHESPGSPGSHEGLEGHEGHESEGPLVLNFQTGHFHNST